MPKRKPLIHDVNWAEGYNAALAKVEKVLPQIIALAEKRGAEGAWKEAIKLSNEIEIAEPDGGIRQWIAFKRFRNTLRDYLDALTQSPYEQ